MRPRSPASTQRLSGAASTFSTGTPLMAMMRPRSMGASASLASGSTACTVSLEGRKIVERRRRGSNSQERRSRCCSSNSPSSERSISAMATSKPEPETERDWRPGAAIEPGPAMLGERERRGDGAWRGGIVPRSVCSSRAEAGEQQDEAGDDAGGDRGGDDALLGGRDGEREQRQVRSRRRDDEAKRRPFARSSVRWERISTAGGTTLRRGPSGQSTKSSHGEEAGERPRSERQRMRLDGKRDGQRVGIKSPTSSAGVSAPSTSPMAMPTTGEHQRLDGDRRRARAGSWRPRRLEGGDDLRASSPCSCRMALPTPMPPSSSAVSPTKLTNWVKRSTSRRMRRARDRSNRVMAKPLCGNLASMVNRAVLSSVWSLRALAREASSDRSSGSGSQAGSARCGRACRATSAPAAHRRGGRQAGQAGCRGCRRWSRWHRRWRAVLPISTPRRSSSERSATHDAG